MDSLDSWHVTMWRVYSRHLLYAFSLTLAQRWSKGPSYAGAENRNQNIKIQNIRFDFPKIRFSVLTS